MLKTQLVEKKEFEEMKRTQEVQRAKMDKEMKLKFINQTIRERKLLSAQKMRALKKVLLLLQRLNRKK